MASLASRLADLCAAFGADIKSINAKKNRDRVYTNAAASGTLTLNLALYDVFNITLSGNLTLAYTGVPTLSSESITPVVKLTCGATGYTTTWWSGITTWLNSGGSAPPGPTAGKTGVFAFSTENGTSWTAYKGGAT